MIAYCMTDNTGSQVEAPLIHMQSCETLRTMIRSGIRTEESWAELKTRSERWHAALRIIRDGLPMSSTHSSPQQEGIYIR